MGDYSLKAGINPVINDKPVNKKEIPENSMVYKPEAKAKKISESAPSMDDCAELALHGIKVISQNTTDPNERKYRQVSGFPFYVSKDGIDKFNKIGKADVSCVFLSDDKKNLESAPKLTPKEYQQATNAEFFYENGINTDLSGAENTVRLLTELAGPNIKINLLYNKTFGIGKDIHETEEEIRTRKSDGESHKAALRYSESLSSGHKVKIICHSQGAMITANALNECKEMLLDKEKIALKNHNPKLSEKEIQNIANAKVEKLMSKVEVLTMGGAASQERFPKEVTLTQITNPNDLISNSLGNFKLGKNLIYDAALVSGVTIIAPPIGLIAGTVFGGAAVLCMVGKALPNSVKDLIPNDVRNTVGSIARTVTNLGIAIKSTCVAGISDHLVDKGKDGYINQPKVRSTIYNWFCQDAQKVSK